MKQSEDVGKLLQHERQNREMTVRALAQRAGVSPAIVSRIEQGHSSPSFSTLKKILDVFGITFADFFKGDKSVPESPVIRKKDMATHKGIGEKLNVTLVNAGTSSEIQMFVEQYAPGGHSGKEMLTHRSVETGICLEGNLVLELDGKTYQVSKGDGWFFNSRLPHRFSNQSNKPAVLISANTPATF